MIKTREWIKLKMLFTNHNFSCETESFGLFDGDHKSLVKDLLGWVLWKINLIEAGVSARQSHDIIGLDLCYGKLLRASHANQSLEAIQRHLGAACDKLQELCTV